MGERLLVPSYALFQQSFSQLSGAQHGILDALNGMGALQREQVLPRPGDATDIASETYGHTVSFLASESDSDKWDTRRALEKPYWDISLHGIQPTPLEPIESKWSGFGDHVISMPYMPKGIIWIFSFGVEVNGLGGLQAVENDSKLSHKCNEIREIDSLVFDQV
ncbi:hypothetical protein TNCV_2943541 [Trichonephila clavipes]|nr:hypothetical protein TNCV_2943541 [Trichonephila clavipes]